MSTESIYLSIRERVRSVGKKARSVIQCRGGPRLATEVAPESEDLGRPRFLVAQVIGKKCSAVIGFETAEDAKQASALIKKTSRRAGK